MADGQRGRAGDDQVCVVGGGVLVNCAMTHEL